MLSSCPALERLKVWLSKGLVRLRVAGGRKSLALKRLNIKKCLGLQSVEICGADQLVSFSLDYFPKCEVRLENVPKLVKVSLFYFSGIPSADNSLYSALNMLSCCVSQLQILKLRSIREAMFAGNQRLEFRVLMTNLKHLALYNIINPLDDWCVRHLDSFMKASPHLEKLKLSSSRISPLLGAKDEYVKVDKYAHEHLKKLELFCCSAPQHWIEIARYLVENAVALEKFTLFSNECNEGRSDHVIDQLKAIIPSTVEFERRFQ